MAGWASLIGPVLGGIFQNRAAKKAAAALTAAGELAYRRSLPKGVTGMFGNIPVTFCQLCLNSMIEMVRDLSEGEDEDMCI